MSADITTVPETDWVAVPREFALSPAVVEAAGRWPLTADVDRAGPLAVHLRCGSCNQSILPLATPAGAYGVRITDMTGQLLSHLIQRHGWTREAPSV